MWPRRPRAGRPDLAPLLGESAQLERELRALTDQLTVYVELALTNRPGGPADDKP